MIKISTKIKDTKVQVKAEVGNATDEELIKEAIASYISIARELSEKFEINDTRHTLTMISAMAIQNIDKAEKRVDEENGEKQTN